MSQVCDEVASRLREKILCGEWEPGFRLPVRTELVSSLNSNHYTVQNAIKKLESEGYLAVGARKSGTRVAPNPPHITSYYLIMPESPGHWGHFWKALAETAEAKSGENCNIKCVYRLSGHDDIADYQQMITDVQNKSVAGIIFASSADEFIDSPLLDTPGIPRVAISYPNRLPGVPKIKLDINSFIDRAVAHLVDQGCKKLAILAPDNNTAARFRKAMADHGLDCNNAWIQFPRCSFKEGARNTVEIMMSPTQPNRPDGLIIADDNLIEGSTEWLAESNINIPDELSIVTQNNFPHIIQTKLPVTRFGFDIPALLDMLMSRLQKVSDGKDVAENTTLSVIPESEFNKKGK